MVDGAREAFIPVPHDPSTWAARTRADAVIEFDAWKEYWRKLTVQFEYNGEVSISGEPVRCFINVDGSMLIHASDIERLKESRDYAILLKRQEEKLARHTSKVSGLTQQS